MDFNSLIHVAQRYDKDKSSSDSRYYSTKFEPPKKEERNKQLSDNIKKFLAKKEAEEQQKALKAHQKRDELLALRAKDKKATRRVNVMLKSTKSANKSAIQDAVDNDNTAVTLVGPAQPDEDDYGYVSQEASAFYNKMMEKYNNLPDEPKIFKDMKKKVDINLNGTKDRVRAALLREQEEAMMPPRRKRKSKHDKGDGSPGRDDKDSQDDHHEQSRSEEKPSKPKPKPGPPPMNFADLLKLAEKKQFEPVKIEPKKKSEDEEHPMTKRQRRLAEEERIQRERREERRKLIESGKLSNDSKISPPANKIPKLNNGQSSSSQKTESQSKTVSSSSKSSRPEERRSRSENVSGSKLRATLEKGRDSKVKPKVSSSSPSSTSLNEKSLKRPYDENKNIPRKDNNSSSSKMPPPSAKPYKSNSDIPKPRPSASDYKNGVNPSKKPSNLPSKEVGRPSDDKRPPDPKSKQLSSNGKPRPIPPSDGRPKQFPPSDLRPKQFLPSDLRPKQFPPADLQPRPKQFPPSDPRPKQFPPADVRRKPKKGKIIDDDDSEYDSEMDDFIDDDDEDMDYSKHISEIFGYDKNKYRKYDEEDDDDMMESSFSQLMREEYISSKIGLKEDLEDMKQEAEEKKRKAARMKAMRR